MPAQILRRRDMLMAPWTAPSKPLMIGQPQAALEGLKVLESGGNAVDAAVTGALTAGTVALLSSGIAGYGGHMVIAWPDGKVRVIDFNTVAPKNPPDRVHQYGWLSVGVPATLAGLDFALRKYGTRSFRQCVAPAVRYANEGFPLPESLANSIRNLYPEHFSKDPAAAKLFAPGGKTPEAGALFRNSDLGAVLDGLGRDNSAEAFYRGALARRIARGFKERGGTVTAADLAAYHAREVDPIEWRTGEWRAVSAPLTSGGATTLQALAALDRVKQTVGPGSGPKWQHARLEALRIAWRDRLALMGDPSQSPDPTPKLLSDATAEGSARMIRTAVKAGKAIDIATRPVEADGTTHLSVADSSGMLVSVTFTHGDGFGARVVVPGLGLILGHGLSRFDPASGHPNSLAPGRRPLHNMCPAVLFRAGRPVVAVGATGGRRIPNALFDVISRITLEGQGLRQAVDGQRINTTGGRDTALTGAWSAEDRAYLKSAGFDLQEAGAAVIQALAIAPDPVTASR